MKVFIVRDEDHGSLFVAANLGVVKRELIRTNWVHGHSLVWNCEKHDYWDSLLEVYGENWRESFMDFGVEDLENLGIYVKEIEVVQD